MDFFEDIIIIIFSEKEKCFGHQQYVSSKQTETKTI